MCLKISSVCMQATLFFNALRSLLMTGKFASHVNLLVWLLPGLLSISSRFESA